MAMRFLDLAQQLAQAQTLRRGLINLCHMIVCALRIKTDLGAGKCCGSFAVQ